MNLWQKDQIFTNKSKLAKLAKFKEMISKYILSISKVICLKSNEVLILFKFIKKVPTVF